MMFRGVKLGSPQFLVESVLLVFLVFCVVLCYFVLCPMLPVSLDGLFLVASLVFSNVYFIL